MLYCHHDHEEIVRDEVFDDFLISNNGAIFIEAQMSFRVFAISTFDLDFF